MDATSPPALDPVTLVRQLDAEAIRNRLDDLDLERDALVVLLRAALRVRRPDARPKTKGRADDAATTP